MDHLTRLTTTEGRNPASEGLDQLTTLEVLHVMNDEDHRVPDAVARQLPAIAAIVEAAVAGLSAGGRLISMPGRERVGGWGFSTLPSVLPPSARIPPWSSVSLPVASKPCSRQLKERRTTRSAGLRRSMPCIPGRTTSSSGSLPPGAPRG